MTSKPHTPDTDLINSDPLPRKINAPDLGGSFEENGQVRLHDGIGAGPGVGVAEIARELRIPLGPGADARVADGIHGVPPPRLVMVAEREKQVPRPLHLGLSLQQES